MNKTSLKIGMRGLENIKNKKIRIFKLDRVTRIKNFIHITETTSKINVILPDFSGKKQPYGLSLDGSIQSEVSFLPPSPFDGTVSEYLQKSRHAIVNGQLHIFGGGFDPFQVTKKFINDFISNILLSDCPARRVPIQEIVC